MSLGVEFRLSRRTSLDVSGVWNPWTFKDETCYKQWSVMPELRWWPSQKGAWDRRNSALTGHFLGLHLLGGEYNYTRIRLPFNAFPDLKGHRFQGWMLGGGLTYGYRYNVSKRIALEAFASVGVAHVHYDKYTCGKCGERLSEGHKLYVGPTKLGFSLVVRLGKNPRIKRCDATTKTVTITNTIEKTVERVDTVFLGIPLQETGDMKNLLSATYELRLQYPLSSSEIIENLGSNRRQIEGLSEFIESYAENPDVRIASIDIEGWASLEGAWKNNLSLSSDRASSAALMLGEMFPDLAPLIHAQGKGEDWISPKFDGKGRLMLIKDLDERERQLKLLDGGQTYQRLLKTQLPSHRRIECIIKFTELK